jgi:hypothetical protein
MAAIKLDLEHTTTPPGGRLTGVVNLVVEAPLAIRAVRLKLSGYERALAGVPSKPPVDLADPPGAGAHSAQLLDREITLTGQEAFRGRMEAWADAWSSVLGRRRHPVLQWGEYAYPFAVEPPKGLLPSYIGGACEVRYYLTAYVDRPRIIGSRRPSVCKEITVLPLPVEGEPACVSEPESPSPTDVVVTASVDSNVAAPGGDLRVRYQVSSPEGRAIGGLQGSLFQIERTRRRGSKIGAAAEVAGHFDPFKDESAREQQGELILAVPKDAPPSFEGRYAAVAYELRVSAQIPWAVDVRVKLDVKVAPPG